MIHYLIIPGLGNSGPEHWQTYFENSADNFRRVNQLEWDAPDCNDWVNTLDAAISEYDPSNVVLIAHSLGCATVAHWYDRSKLSVRGAMLVAPSDIETPAYTFPATGFAPIPLVRFNFRTIVVASADDPWVSIERAQYFANHWGSEFINIGNAGHINAASGHTRWNEGLEILKRL
jgi:hypothetical protein